MTVLIRVKPKGKCFEARTCWPTDYCGENIIAVAQSRSDAISMLPECLTLFIEESGRKYIESDSFEKGLLNCPQGHVKLPIDIWYCKNAKTACPLQGQLNISEPESFFKLCLLPDETKKGIWNAIKEEKYKGFHHMQGRFRCCLCNKTKSQQGFNYHYPWELTLLSDHCDIKSIWNDPNRAKDLVLKGVHVSALYSSLCWACFQEVSNFLPEINRSEYESISCNYQRSK